MRTPKVKGRSSSSSKFDASEHPQRGQEGAAMEVSGRVLQAEKLADSSDLGKGDEDILAYARSIPAEEGWKVYRSEVILPMSVLDFWKTFLANDAPYLLLNNLRAVDCELTGATHWMDSETKRIPSGEPILKHRVYETRNKTPPIVQLISEWVDSHLDSNVLSMSNQELVLKDISQGHDFPYSSTF